MNWKETYNVTVEREDDRLRIRVSNPHDDENTETAVNLQEFMKDPDRFADYVAREMRAAFLIGAWRFLKRAEYERAREDGYPYEADYNSITPLAGHSEG